MRKLPKIIVLLLLVAAVIFAAGCVQKKVTPVNETITPVNKTVTPVNETVAPVNESVVQENVSAGTNRTVTLNDGKKTHSRNHNTPTTTENNTTENNVTTPTQTVNLSVHGHSTKIVSLKVTPENPTVSLGQTQQFTAIGTFSDSSIKDITDIAILSSSNTTVASISDSGLATSKSIGITQINATYDGISSTDQTLTVIEVKLVSIEIFPVMPTIHLGQTQKFTAIGTYSDGNTKDITANVTWLSSNNTVANISASGLASSISLGTTQINATCDGISSPDQRLKVIDAKLEFVTVTPQNPNITLNRTRQFIANGTYSDGSTKDITDIVIWSSSNTTVANISASGLATPSSTGITQINATNSDIECLYPQLSILSQTLTVTDAELISIAITPLDPIVTSNQTQQFIANGTYSDGSIIDVTAIVNWSSSNTTVANISVSGLAMAVSQGTTQINATIGEISSPDQTLTVPEPQPQHNNTNVRLISIEISPVNSTVVLGQTQQFSANGTYSDGSKKDITANATWSSSNTTVANINASGLATSSSVGTTQINATINGINSTDQTLTVTDAKLISVAITPLDPIVTLNQTKQFIANGTYSDGSIKDITAIVNWSSSNTTVANINASGLATPSSAGTTKINATIGEISSPDQTLTVPEPQHNNTNVTRLTSIEISPVNPAIPLNETQQFLANGTYSDGSIKDITATATWSSSNITVASINTSGLATSTSMGITQISATSEGISSTDQTLTVTKAKPVYTVNDTKLVSITVTPLNPTVSLGQTQQFIANGAYSDGSTKDITDTVIWSSSNTMVAGINASGLATSASLGSTQINATSGGISSTDQTLMVTDAKLVFITITPVNPTVALGQTQQFTANGTYSDGSTKDITNTVIWSSNNATVAGINASGLATSASLGSTQINATSEGISSTDQTLTVTDAKLVSITITPINPTVSLGQTQQFIANGTYSDGSTKDITDTAKWSSSDTMVAGINASGLATSTFLGTTQINATSEGISSTDQTLTVTDAKLVSITITPVNSTVALGQTQQFTANGTYSDGSTKDITDTATWSSSNTMVAGINVSGLATSASLGSTQINATSEGISSTDQTLTVTDAKLVSISITPINPTVALGQTQQFTANGTYSDGSTKDITNTVIWSSNNATVASINASGLATSASVGTTQINATSEGISSTDQTLTVTVKLVSIIVSPLNPIISLDQTQQFIAVGIYSDGSTKDITATAIWSSSNLTVASINVTGLAKSKFVGTTYINATSNGISSSDQTLTVTDGFGITIVPYMDSKYKYKIVNHGEDVGFENVNYDDSDFSIGNASFGFIDATVCDIYSSKYIKTLWLQGTDILLRKEFVLPAGVTSLKVNITVDNDVQVFINGYDVSNGIQTHEMCATWDYFEFPVDNSILKTGTNLLAVRGKDRSGINFLDTKITADYKDFPIIGIKKFTNGKDANEAPGPLVSPDSTVIWTYAVTNIGKVNITQSNISLTDSDSAVIPVYIGGDTNDDDNMGPGETWVYIANGIAKEGQYANIGRITIDYNGTKLYFEDPSHYYGKK